MALENEQEIVRRSRQSPEAFGALYDEYYPRIYGYAVKRTGHVQAAQDITAEVFFKAYKKLWQFAWRKIPFGAWLYKIATNEINDYFRRGQKAPVPVAFLEELDYLAVSADTPFRDMVQTQAEAEARGLFVKIQKQLRCLPANYQAALALRYFEGKSIGEIAEILGKREGTVKSLLSRGLRKLQARMQPFFDLDVISTKAPSGPKLTINQPSDYERPTP